MSDDEVKQLLGEALDDFDDPTLLPHVSVQHRSGTILQQLEQKSARLESRMATGEMSSSNSQWRTGSSPVASMTESGFSKAEDGQPRVESQHSPDVRGLGQGQVSCDSNPEDVVRDSQ